MVLRLRWLELDNFMFLSFFRVAIADIFQSTKRRRKREVSSLKRKLTNSVSAGFSRLEIDRQSSIAQSETENLNN